MCVNMCIFVVSRSVGFLVLVLEPVLQQQQQQSHLGKGAAAAAAASMACYTRACVGSDLQAARSRVIIRAGTYILVSSIAAV